MTQIKLEKPWIYLGHQYTGHEEDSIKYAHEQAYRFRRLGFLTYSPIESTHYAHQQNLKKRKLMKKLALVDSKYSIDDIETEYPQIDWLSQDRELLIALACPIDLLQTSDTNLYMALDPDVFKTPLFIRHHKFNKQHPSEYKKALDEKKITLNEFEALWISKGCFQEYLFADHYGIPIIDTKRFLHVVENLMVLRPKSKKMLINIAIERYPEILLFEY